MNKSTQYRDYEAIQELVNIVQHANEIASNNLSFVFYPQAVVAQDMGTAQWQAKLTISGKAAIQYGKTLEEAAEQLLDIILHPEKYPEPDDD